MGSYSHTAPEKKTLSEYLPHLVREIDLGRTYYNKTQAVLSLVNFLGTSDIPFNEDTVVEDSNSTTASGILWYLGKDGGQRLGCSVNVGKKPYAVAVGKFASYVVSKGSEKNLHDLQQEMNVAYRECFEGVTPCVSQVLIKRPHENKFQVLLGNTDLNSRIALIYPFDSEIALALIFDSTVLGAANYKLNAHEDILRKIISAKEY